MKRYALSRPERITRSSEFKEAFKNGKIYRSKTLNLNIAPNNYGISRIGISLRRGNFNLATQRNKLRRYLKEIFRLNKYDLKKGYDIIAMPKATCLNLTFNAMKDSFIDLVKRAGIFKLQ